MKAISLLYHDVVSFPDLESSGFPGAGAAVYKIELPEFDAHLDILAAHISQPPGSVATSNSVPSGAAPPVYLTFDDGGSSADTIVRDRLSALGWTGHFFVTGDRIDTPGFLSRSQIRSLHSGGHVIGSHSWSHPPRMSACNFDTLLQEWRRSTAALAEIIGERVQVASVPGGFYSRLVAEAAAEAGIRFLFTSEPTKTVEMVDSCSVYGRYSITRRTKRNALPGFVSSTNSWSQASQVLNWRTRKVMKAVLGQTYISTREKLLSWRGTAVERDRSG